MVTGKHPYSQQGPDILLMINNKPLEGILNEIRIDNEGKKLLRGLLRKDGEERYTHWKSLEENKWLNSGKNDDALKSYLKQHGMLQVDFKETTT